MNLSELRHIGGVVSDAPVKRQILWKDGGQEHAFDVFIKLMAFGDVERLFVDPVDPDRSRTALMISECVRLGDGSESLTYEDAYQLKPSLAGVLSQAITEVNGLRSDEAKN